MAAYFLDREVSKSEADFPQPSDELVYDDDRIPPKLACPFLSNEVLMRGVLKNWTGEELELYDNSAPFFDSFRVEEEAEKGPQAEKPEVGYNLRYEKIEKTPSVLKYRLCFGKGEATFNNGCKYTGDMAFSMMHGRGVLEADNFIYSGTFRSGEIEGNGKYEWENAVYEGDLKRGLRNGEGTLTFKSGVEYDGNWREGLRDGFGKLTFPDGQSYEGLWKDGLKHGHGVQKFASGNYYEGDFENDLRSGQGTMYWPSSSEKYTGQWREGLPNGYGVHIWLDPFGSGVKQLRNRYVGQWLNGMRHGYGVFYYANGSKYEGNWVENKKEGDGVYTYEDGSTYEGPFANDHMVNRTVTGFVDVKTEEKTSPVPAAVPQPALDASRRPARGAPSRGQPPAPVPAVTAKKSRISGSRAKKLIEMNPYKGLIDISDLLELEADELRAEKEVQNVLLKYNSDLKSWYLQYSTQVEPEEREESFTMTSRQLWRFLRDCQILSYRMTVAQVNRLFILGKKSNFSLDAYEPPKLDIGPSRSPTPMRATPLLDISKINPQGGESFNEDYESEEEEEGALSNQLQNMELEDVHKPNRTLLQRQFVEALVRVAFLKYSNGGVLELSNEVVGTGEQAVEMELPKSQIGIAVFRLFREKLVPFAGQSSFLTDKKEQELQEGLAAISKEAVDEVFSRLAKKDRGHLNGHFDQTIEVRSILNFLKDKGIVPSKLPEPKFFELVELGHDSQTAYSKLIESAAKAEDQSKVLFLLLGMELVKTEFTELLVHLGAVVAGNDDRRLKARPIKEKLKRFFDLMTGMTKQPSAVSADVTGPQPDASQPPSDVAPAVVPATPKITMPVTVLLDRGRQQVLTGKLALGAKKEQARKEELDRLDQEKRGMKANDINIDIVPFQ